jgi:hypothetical protein
MLTKTDAIAIFGSVKALQEALGLKSHATISMWPTDRSIPRVHELEIRYRLRPEAFDAEGNLAVSKSQ